VAGDKTEKKMTKNLPLSLSMLPQVHWPAMNLGLQLVLSKGNIIE
jgi:hypothetical protein